MDIRKEVRYKILRDASKKDLVPVALLGKYDLPARQLISILNSLFFDGALKIGNDSVLKITDSGRHELDSLRQQKENKRMEKKEEYMSTVFDKTRIDINEPYLPSIETYNNIMEGRQNNRD